MVATTRERSRAQTKIGTKLRLSDQNLQTSTRFTLRETCTDVVGDYGNQHALALLRTTITGGRINGTTTGGVLRYTFSDYPCDSFVDGVSVSPYLNVNSYKNAALARTGISSPITNLPLFVAELKDIPRMLKHAGDLLHGLRRLRNMAFHKEIAKAVLSYQFGWAPLISDIRKLIDFHESVDKRARQIDDAFNRQGGYHGRATLDRNKFEAVSPLLVNSSAQVTVNGFKHITTEKKIWASVPWTPTTSTRKLGYHAASANVFRNALGLNARNIPLTAWKLLPWSWLSDYSFNVSEALIAMNNRIDYTPGIGCIMVNEVVTERHTGGSANGVTIQPFEKRSELKQRFVITSWGSGIPPLKLPFLDGFKLSVLGSLAILKIAK